MNSQLKSSDLDTLGVLRARGADVIPFLQGQLSNDVARLAPTRSLLAGYHTPQGRAIALPRLLENAPGDVLAILPRELIAPVIARLGKFILRSQVKLSDDTRAWTIHGLAAAGPDAGATSPSLPGEVNEMARAGEALVVRLSADPARALVVQPRDSPSVLTGIASMSAQAWRAGVIAAAEPQVYAATSEEFVAQMLNLDLLGAIAFDKGCYTGQEVIARAHYRGRVKRRLQRFETTSAARLVAGDAGELPDGRSVKVVDAVQRPDGTCEFLGVAGFATDDADGAITAPPAAAAGRVIDARPLPIPYALPR